MEVFAWVEEQLLPWNFFLLFITLLWVTVFPKLKFYNAEELFQSLLQSLLVGPEQKVIVLKSSKTSKEIDFFFYLEMFLA